MSYGTGLIPLASTILAATTATITFSGIPANYNGLVLFYTARSSSGSTSNVELQVNGDTGSHYNRAEMHTPDNATNVGQSVVPLTTFILVGPLVGATGTATMAGSGVLWLPFYADTTFIKQVFALAFADWGNTTTTNQIWTSGGVWANTSAITSLSLFLSSGSFLTGSQVDLYGRI